MCFLLFGVVGFLFTSFQFAPDTSGLAPDFIRRCLSHADIGFVIRSGEVLILLCLSDYLQRIPAHPIRFQQKLGKLLVLFGPRQRGGEKLTTIIAHDTGTIVRLSRVPFAAVLLPEFKSQGGFVLLQLRSGYRPPTHHPHPKYGSGAEQARLYSRFTPEILINYAQAGYKIPFYSLIFVCHTGIVTFQCERIAAAAAISRSIAVICSRHTRHQLSIYAPGVVVSVTFTRVPSLTPALASTTIGTRHSM